MNEPSLWQRFNAYFLKYQDLGFSIDISRMRFEDDFFQKLTPLMQRAFEQMGRLEKGEIANPDEQRMVGHYWLRAPHMAPGELVQEITPVNEAICSFAKAVHEGKILAENGQRFTHVLLIGIGGSALGPQFISDALGTSSDKMSLRFFDNTDPDGMDRVLDGIGEDLAQTLTIVISKSGGTKETRNGMLEAASAYQRAGINFAKHAVAVTGVGSLLDKLAESSGWIQRFPMSDWVGGRTSVMSAVGLLPAALQGLDIRAFLAGAAAMDAHTRQDSHCTNAAMLLAAMWYYAGNGKGEKDMVILPYKDRLVLFSKYLQQLVMESLGKEKDLDGNVVNQGIAVYGNKGSTDQHAYVQQLRDGVPNFFVTLLEVRKDRSTPRLEVESGITSGDYLQGFLRGTRSALYENHRDSITISIPEVNEYQLGALIALFERAVGFYASLVNINAYHQPGVEAGKKAATRLLELQSAVMAALEKSPGKSFTAETLAEELKADPEDVYHVLLHLVENHTCYQLTPGNSPSEDAWTKIL